MFVVEAHDVHHLVLDVAHQVRALGDGDLQVDSNDREVIGATTGQINVMVRVSNM